MKTNGLSEQREKTVDAIRDVGELMKEYLNEYIFCELDHADVINKEISASVKQVIVMNGAALILFVFLIMAAIFVVNNSISSPIKALVKTTKQVGSGDFNVRVNSHGKKDEIAILNDNFNTMVSRLQGLVDDVRISTENLKKVELQLLQEQINPHFLYNTLETIIWMAEKKDNEKVIKLVQDLSTFFHTTLSGGKAVITIKEELRHIESYLAIQQVRYEDIMEYHIDVAEDIKEFMIPKLTLQPIVENALYHGIKNKRGGGCIQIHGSLIDDQTIEIVIQDTGKGMDEETLAKLRKNIQSASIIKSEKGKGFGLPNVQKRLQLYCGGSYGVTVDSTLNEGTTVTLHLGCDIHPKE